MTAARLEWQPPCSVCGTARQVQECRPLAPVGRVESCPACSRPSPVPVLCVPMRVDVPRGGAS